METRYILVTSYNHAQVYTDGLSYSLRKRLGFWKTFVTSRHGESHRARTLQRAQLTLGCTLEWEACGDPPVTFYQDTFPNCPGCKMRDGVIQQLFDALQEGWIDLRSNKFKRLKRLAEGATTR
jgi:hypothetical protein